MATQVKKTSTTKSTIKDKNVEESKLKVEETVAPEISEATSVESKVNADKVETQAAVSNEVQQKLETENAELRSKLENQSKEFAEMQAQLKLLMQTIASGSGAATAPSVPSEEEDVAVGCRVFSGLGMTNGTGTSQINFKCGEKKYIAASDLREYLKENIRQNKTLFAKGLLFFYDEANYAKFKIRKQVDLSEDAVVDIITTSNTNEMIRKVNTITNNLHDEAVLYTFKYIIADMLISQSEKLKDFTYDNRKALEDYFRIKFDTLIQNAGMYRTFKGLTY